MADSNSDRLPMHKVVIEGIKNVVRQIENEKSRKPQLSNSRDLSTIFNEHVALANHEKEVARLEGELKAYLNVATANINGEHLAEIKKELWQLAYTGNNQLISTLRSLEEKKIATS